MNSILEKLNIQPVNAGACIGPDGWLKDPKGKELVSYNPTTGEATGTVVQATPETYEKVAAAAQQAFLTWRAGPGSQARPGRARPGRRPARDRRSRWATW